MSIRRFKWYLNLSAKFQLNENLRVEISQERNESIFFGVSKILDDGRCGYLNKNGPHRLIGLNAWSTGSATIRSCGLVGVGVALVEKVCN